MAIYTGGMRMQDEARAASKRIAKQQAKAQKGEAKRKGRAGIFGKIAGAGLDVFEEEPLLKSHPLWKMPNVIITPHIASLTVVDTAVKYMYSKYCEYLKNGRIKNDINLKKGY